MSSEPGATSTPGSAPAAGSVPSARVVRYGAQAVLVDLPGLDAVRRLDADLRAAPPPGTVDVVPAARTLLVVLAGPAAAARAVDGLTRRAGAAVAPAPGPPDGPLPVPPGVWMPPDGPAPGAGTVVLPVTYDGPDLAEVAELTGLAVEEVVRRHAAATYTVAFGGFMPGFAYLTGGDPALRVPRRDSPRERVPAGSVAVAGEFSAVYPAATPGGWRLLGTCDAVLFDPARRPPALLVPGATVRFEPVAAGAGGGGRSAAGRAPSAARPVAARAAAAPPPGARHAAPAVEVLDPGVLTLVQDRGRPGWSAVGVGRSGAADRRAARLVNRLVGNAPDAAVLEVLAGGLTVRFRATTVLALGGADAPADLDGRPVAAHTAVVARPGAVLRLGYATHGLRAYLAVRGGVDVPAVLGSRATDQLSGTGPAPVRAGDVLPVGGLVQDAAQPWPDPPRAWAPTVTLRLLPGPRPDWFALGALRTLTGGTYTVTPAGNRVALRLDGPQVPRRPRGELPSEPLVPGAVQVPPDGLPVVFLADHPVTGGYPVVAVVDPASLDDAAQAAPGQPVRFTDGR